MATKSVAKAYHATLTAAAVDTITFTGASPKHIEVYNRGTDLIYCTTEGDATPTVAGDDTTAVGAGESVLMPGNTTCRLISASATPYSVQRVDS